ncbi:AraC family transcriptional regulator [Rufibacter tibetensis]|nr:AraC family transcriptional regulator [Rufibacter tibetensis]
MNNRLHYHPEVEIIHLHKGSGMQLVGDSITRFSPGDIVLIGANVPHFWRYDELDLCDNNDAVAFSTAIHFRENFWGDRFLNLPETKQLKVLLDKAKRGILIKGKTGQKVKKLMSRIQHSTGVHRMLALLECLSVIAEEDGLQLLSSFGFMTDLSDTESERLNLIYEHTLTHFKRKIHLEEIAGIAGIIPNSFCRYFKERTGKTYTQFLTEIRVGFACKLIIANKMSIKQLCYESGFNNFSCFHKNFKGIMGKTPQSYQNQYIRTGL